MGGEVMVQSYSVKPGPKADPAIRDRIAAFHTVEPLIVARRGGNEDRWAISMGRDVWTREGGWEWEPLPSSRDEAFFLRARWTLAEALAVLDVEVSDAR